jgi:hypothetical protein
MLKKWGLESGGEQLGFYASSAASSFYAGRSAFRAYHLMQAAANIKNPEISRPHMYYARVNPADIEAAAFFARKFASNGVAVGLGVPLFYIAWIGANHRANLKNRGR